MRFTSDCPVVFTEVKAAFPSVTVTVTGLGEVSGLGSWTAVSIKGGDGGMGEGV